MNLSASSIKVINAGYEVVNLVMSDLSPEREALVRTEGASVALSVFWPPGTERARCRVAVVTPAEPPCLLEDLEFHPSGDAASSSLVDVRAAAVAAPGMALIADAILQLSARDKREMQSLRAAGAAVQLTILWMDGGYVCLAAAMTPKDKQPKIFFVVGYPRPAHASPVRLLQ